MFTILNIHLALDLKHRNQGRNVELNKKDHSPLASGAKL